MQTWKDFNIYLGEEVEQADTGLFSASCPKCKSSHPSLLVNMHNKVWFCQHCGFSGSLHQGLRIAPTIQLNPWAENPNINEYNLVNEPNKTISNTFSKLGISNKTLQHFHITHKKNAYFPSSSSNQPALVFPYMKGSVVQNLIYLKGNERASEYGGVPICFNYNGISEENTFIVLDEIEVLSFYESGKPNAISLFGGQDFKKEQNNNSIESIINTRLEFLVTIEDKLKQIKKITIAMPSTDIGEQIKNELLRRIGKERCWVISPPEAEYTWNKTLSDYGAEKFHNLLANAKAIPVRGIFEVDDIEEELDNLYYNGLSKGASTGFPSVDDFYTVVPGQWTIVTGIPGHGKSNFLDAILVNLAKFNDWKFGLFSPENQPIARHFAGIMEKYYGQSFEKDRLNRISEEQKEDGKIWLKKHFSIILPHEDDNSTIDGILSLAKTLVFRKGIKGLVIDPWNEIDHARPSGQTETEYISMVLTKIRQFARNYNVHVWVVAHPAKLYKDKTTGKYPVPTPYDISGSAHYRNKADNAITVHRNVGGVDQDVSDIYIQKIRFKEVGRVGMASLRYNAISGQFTDDIDQEKRGIALTQTEATPTAQLMVQFY